MQATIFVCIISTKITATKLTKWAESELLLKQDNSCTYQVLSLNLHEFIVKCGKFKAHVDILAKTCSCRAFQLDYILCEYAVTVCRHRSFEYHLFCSPYYTTDAWIMTYAETIYPLGPINELDVLIESFTTDMQPPIFKPKKGVVK